ncbi:MULTISPECIES: hypothetical protein [Clostridium]|uniref:Uncharacterized protein n=1 Tax=Clostridium frigoriphilum TaxID=443253 RepID=A0ABU7UW25_9CLOT|nr:hypothetical protein [Clostridium sp. DSM 17811]MBU3102239.1 hypothetical protein [Clostridium sp. DSM 17811]
MKIVPDDNNIKVGKLTYKDDYIGRLGIKQECDNIIVNVEFEDYDANCVPDSVDFPVDDELEMYPIINYIITKFNYKFHSKPLN